MNKDSARQNKLFFIFSILVVVIIVLVSLTAGFWLSDALFRFTGRPSEFLAYIIMVFIGFFLLAIVILIILLILNKLGHRGGGSHIIGETLEALDRISHGDFTVALDIKENNRFTELNKSINEMAKNLGALEAMRQDFISNVSHEIQSPLTSISGFAELLQNDALPVEKRGHYAAVIKAESNRLSALSENLLKLSVLESQGTTLSTNEFRLDKQIESVALALEPQWSAKNIELEAELIKTPYSGDEGLLSQVWINLLHNAIKFTPQGGQIHIQLSTNETGIAVKVSDTGLGISADDQMHIFERFYKADKARDRSLGGNGLGLSLVKKIVELHGGNVTVVSEFGKGAAFTVQIPKK
jgi:signal transduction histidine kinase